MQKLDLLNHLVTNFTNGIVVCGPDGIGKSRLLELFQKNAEKPIITASLQADSKTQFDQITENLMAAIAQAVPDQKEQQLSVALDRINSRGGIVVQIIDDAGSLVPGMVNKVIEYANVHPAVRVVLALSHNELYIKSGTDPALEDCYQIEIPPLTQQQCEDYLEYLSTFSNPRIDFNTINEERVAEIFSETHGIPGKILAFLPEPVKKKTVDYSNPILLSSVVALVLLVLGVQWWSTHHISSEKLPSAESKQENSAANQVAASAPVEVRKEAMPLAADSPLPEQTVAQLPPKPVESPATNPPAGQSVVASNQASGIEEAKPLANNQETVSDNSQPGQQIAEPNAAVPADVDGSKAWVNQQAPENLTMQLMAMPNEQDIQKVIERYPEFKADLRYVKTKTRRGGDRFILFYGSFSDQEQAKTQKQNLPKELQQVWVRKMADLQKQLNTPENPVITE